ncbi:MAG: hypothetical protein ABI675_00750 [Chitinophagaceae bacterium]
MSLDVSPVRLFLVSICICFLFFSCTLVKKEKADFNKAIAGNWLILYPEHEITNAEQRKLYAAAQDSIVSLLGLKTITFQDKGVFFQTDSLFKPVGKWSLNPENNNLFIRNGGKGLDFFAGNLTSIHRDTMQIVETILLGGQKIRLTWFLKRITDKKGLALFSEEKNGWRKVPGFETDAQLRKRIKAMLLYYSLYYEIVSRESAYFAQSRVFLPFKYYQHSMGLRPFNDKSNFSHFFYTARQAEQAHNILSAAMYNLQNKTFPSGKDFVIEYAMFMEQLNEVIKE